MKYENREPYAGGQRAWSDPFDFAQGRPFDASTQLSIDCDQGKRGKHGEKDGLNLGLTLSV
jgi:hypothetical protein